MNSLPKALIVALFCFTLFLIIPTSAYAILVFAPLVLVPIIKLIAIIVGGLTLPVTTFGVIYSKISETRPAKIIFVCVLLIIIVAIASGIVFKILNPERPLL